MYLTNVPNSFFSLFFNLLTLIKTMSSSNVNEVLINRISEIDGMKEGLTIKVKVLFLWRQTFRNNPRQVSSLEMILMDEDGNKIQATVKRNLVADFESLLEEGCFRIINNFGVASNVGDYMLVNHACKISFYRTTNVKVSGDFNPAEGVDANGYHFPTFSDLIQKKIDTRVAFDVVGEVVSSDPMRVTYEYGRENRSMTLVIQDIDGQKIACALWGDFALSLHTYISQPENANAPVIMLLRNAKLKEWQSKPQISNCLFGTKMHINGEILPISQFQESLAANEASGDSSTRLTQLSTGSVVKKPEDYYTGFEIKNIDDISDFNTEIGLTIIASVIAIQVDEGWYYFACRRCSKKVDRNITGKGEPFECGECGGVSDVYGKVRVVIRVQDATGSASFVLFERHITNLIHRSSAFLMDKINKDEGRQEFPSEFKLLLNKKFVFKIQVSLFNLNNNYLAYTVHKLTDDERVIEEVFKHSSAYEEANLNNDASPTSNATKVKEVVDLSGDNANVIDLESITPSTILGKRKIELVDNSGSTGFSSSKSQVGGTLKIPKMEKLE